MTSVFISLFVVAVFVGCVVLWDVKSLVSLAR